MISANTSASRAQSTAPVQLSTRQTTAPAAKPAAKEDSVSLSKTALASLRPATTQSGQEYAKADVQAIRTTSKETDAERLNY